MSAGDQEILVYLAEDTVLSGDVYAGSGPGDPGISGRGHCVIRGCLCLRGIRRPWYIWQKTLCDQGMSMPAVDQEILVYLAEDTV